MKTKILMMCAALMVAAGCSSTSNSGSTGNDTTDTSLQGSSTNQVESVYPPSGVERNNPPDAPLPPETNPQD